MAIYQPQTRFVPRTFEEFARVPMMEAEAVGAAMDTINVLGMYDLKTFEGDREAINNELNQYRTKLSDVADKISKGERVDSSLVQNISKLRSELLTKAAPGGVYGQYKDKYNKAVEEAEKLKMLRLQQGHQQDIISDKFNRFTGQSIYDPKTGKVGSPEEFSMSNFYKPQEEAMEWFKNSGMQSTERLLGAQPGSMKEIKDSNGNTISYRYVTKDGKESKMSNKEGLKYMKEAYLREWQVDPDRKQFMQDYGLDLNKLNEMIDPVANAMIKSSESIDPINYQIKTADTDGSGSSASNAPFLVKTYPTVDQTGSPDKISKKYDDLKKTLNTKVQNTEFQAKGSMGAPGVNLRTREVELHERKLGEIKRLKDKYPRLANASNGDDNLFLNLMENYEIEQSGKMKREVSIQDVDVKKTFKNELSTFGSKGNVFEYNPDKKSSEYRLGKGKKYEDIDLANTEFTIDSKNGVFIASDGKNRYAVPIESFDEDSQKRLLPLFSLIQSYDDMSGDVGPDEKLSKELQRGNVMLGNDRAVAFYREPGGNYLITENNIKVPLNEKTIPIITYTNMNIWSAPYSYNTKQTPVERSK